MCRQWGAPVFVPTNQWEEKVVEACAETVLKRTVAARSGSVEVVVAVGAVSGQLCSTGGHSQHSRVRVCARGHQLPW